MKADLRARALAALVALAAAPLACAAPGAGGAPPILEPATRPAPATSVVESAPSAATPSGPAADVIFHNAVILTMDESLPQVSAIHIVGETIASVGNDADVLAEAGPATTVIDLGGRTLMPGFVDAHSHYFGRKDLFLTAAAAQDAILAQGITTTAEFFVDEGLLGELEDLGRAGELRVRLSAYLLWNNSCGDRLGDWYLAHPVSRPPGGRLWINGLKIFSDGGSCRAPAVTFEFPTAGHGDLFLTEDELTAAIAELDAIGYQVAIHTLGDRSLDVILDSFEAVLDGQNPRRHRTEHTAMIRPDQLARFGQNGVIPVVFGAFPTCVYQGDTSQFAYLVPAAFRSWEWPWRQLIDANPGLPIAWHLDTGAFELNPVAHLFGLVTRAEVAPDGTLCQPSPEITAGAVTVDEALRMMTINAAYALFRDEEVGSLTPGKYADMIVLSGNPRQIDPDRLRDLRVLMTMVGGKVEYCAEGMEALCPSSAAAPGPSVAVSPEFRDDFEDAIDPGWTWLREDPTAWSLAGAPGWLRLNLSTGSFFGDVPAANLLVRPAPSGDFDLETSLRFTPTRNFEFAGLIVVFADDSVLQFGRAFCDAGPCVGDGYYFDNIQAGAQRGANLAAPGRGEAKAQLRLVRTGSTYTAYLRGDPSSWMEIGSHTVDRGPASVGLLAAQAPAAGTFAEFDYFEIRVP